MTLSEAETNAIEQAAGEGDGGTSIRASWAVEMRRMLDGLGKIEFQPGKAPALIKLCDAGARYGWGKWETAAFPKTQAALSGKAKQSLRNELRRSLVQITRPCFDLERKSFELASNALGLGAASRNSESFDRMFLRGKPSDRLFSMFKKFPVLARLWSHVIVQWQDHVTEILDRIATDRVALSRVSFDRNPLGQIINLRSGLSDPHKNGRTVALLQFEAGSVIYKPRSGEGEREWHSLAQWMNNHSFRPKVKAGRVLCRADYSWMEYIGPTPCPDASGARRFFQRIGGMIAASYLLRAVDCHRQNVVAAGEYPVLVDADALWHVSSITKTQDVFGQLCRTGFFPNSLPGSLQSRSSVLGYGALGNHLAGIGEREPGTAQYRREIVTGFNRAWACLLGTRKRGDAFARRIRRIKTRPRRRIYRATEKYAVIRKASIQPGVLRSNRGRKVLIAQLCARDSVSSAVIGAEVAALQRLDIPYFFRRTKAGMPHHRSGTPYDALETLKRVLSEGADRLGS